MKKTITEIEGLITTLNDMAQELVPALVGNPRALPTVVELAARHGFHLSVVETKNHATGSARQQLELVDHKTGNSAKVEIVTTAVPNVEIADRLLAVLEDVASSPAIAELVREGEALAKKRSEAAKKAAQTKRTQAAAAGQNGAAS